MRTGAAINLQDLRTRIYEMAKSNRKKRFWGLYCHIYKMETLKEAYVKSKRNNGSAGIDGITFRQIEAEGLEQFLKTIQQELMDETYKPNKNRKTEIPKPNGKKRILGIPTIKDRVIQGAIYLVIEQQFSFYITKSKELHSLISF